jgi:peptide/nickel transport system permease protein
MKTNWLRPDIIILIGYSFFALFLPVWQHIMGFDSNYSDILALNLESGAEPLGRFGGISFMHPLGVEPQTGRDVMLRLAEGIRTSVGISLAATIGAILIGVLVGVLSGYFGGWLDNVLNRTIDVILSIPLIFFALAAVPVMQAWLAIGGMAGTNLQRIPILVFILSLFGWPQVARVVRSEVKLYKDTDYVLSARVSGAQFSYITRVHLLPHVWPQVSILSLINFISFIKIEASLSLLGSGVIEPLSSWGAMIALTPQYMASSPTYVTIVGVSFLLFVYVLTRLSDQLVGRNIQKPTEFPY